MQTINKIIAGIFLISLGFFTIQEGARSGATHLTESAAQLTRKQNEAAMARREAQARQVEMQRQNSEIGKDLARRCTEFSQFVADHPGEYAIEERDAACKRYRDYVETGRVI